MTDTSIGFSNPAYNVTHDGGGSGGDGDAGHHDLAKTNGKQVSRTNSIGEDPDHIEVNVLINNSICFSEEGIILHYLQIKCIWFIYSIEKRN